MGNLSRVLVVAAAGALIVGCGTSNQRYGKGNDHEVANLNNRTVYVEKEPRIVYVQQPVVQPAPTVVYYQPAPVYSTTPVYSTRVVPVTRYYYYPTPAN
jgi:hypothetical protein